LASSKSFQHPSRLLAMASICAFKSDKLLEHSVGRIGCSLGDRAYVVPVSYAYDGSHVYGYTADSLKLHAMRENPLVCFEVDEIDSACDWRSVVASGEFEELAADEAIVALELLSTRLRVVSAAAADTQCAAHTSVTRRGRYGVAYRIRLTEKVGRF